MNFIYEKDRIYYAENGKLLAEITFPLVEGHAEITHTFVDESLRGQGIASLLVEEAVKQIRKENLKVTVTCSYAKKWFETHKEEKDLLL